MLLQTKTVLSRPFCVLEIVTAVNYDVPIVAISLNGANCKCGYDFSEANDFMENLEVELNKVNPQVEAPLGGEHGAAEGGR